MWAASIKWHVRPTKTHISQGICLVWSESSLSTWRKLGSLATHWANSEDSDQTGWMPRLIWVFTGCIVILLVLSLIRLGGCPGWSESSLGASHFVGFVMRWLMFSHDIAAEIKKMWHSLTTNWTFYMGLLLKMEMDYSCIPNQNFHDPTLARKCRLTWKGLIRLLCMTTVWWFWRHFWHLDVIFTSVSAKCFNVNV